MQNTTKIKISTRNPTTKNGPIQMIRRDKSTGQNWVKVSWNMEDPNQVLVSQNIS